MCAVTFFLFATFLALASAGTECEPGWTIYKDELCIKAFPNLVTYDEAKEFCSTQNEGSTKASLVMVKHKDLQDLLVAYTNDSYNSLWLGGKYDEATNKFFWEDVDTFTYTNWQEGYPRNSTNTACVELRPINSKNNDVNADAKWADASCLKRIQVMCQRAASWSLQDAIKEIKRIQDELKITKEDLVTTKEELRSGSNAFPIGSIYVEYNEQSNPRSLWPNWAWEDVSALYAGLFFRVTGDASASWGKIQPECSPRISQTASGESGISLPSINQITANGWSTAFGTGYYTSSDTLRYESMQFYTAGCEVRPINQAVRVWKRIA